MDKQVYIWTDEQDGSEHRPEVGQDSLTWREWFKDLWEFLAILGTSLLRMVFRAICFYILIRTLFPWIG